MDDNTFIDKLNEIIRKRDRGKISLDESEKLKFKLVREMDSNGDGEVEFDKGCTTWD